MYMYDNFRRKHVVNPSCYFADEVHILAEFFEIVFLENKLFVVQECNFI